MDLDNRKKDLQTRIIVFTWIGGISAGIALIPLIWAAYDVFQSHSFYKENELGDFIGGTSGTFASFAGLAFVYVGFLGQQLQILMQQEELEMNRQELKDTREEIKGQKEQLELQNKHFRIQAFETVFFQLLKVFRDTSDKNFSIGYGDTPLVEKLNSFVNYQRNSFDYETWSSYSNQIKIEILCNSFNNKLSGGFARVKSISESALSILVHLDKYRELIDHEYFLRVFLGILNIHEQRLIFYSYFSSRTRISDDEKALMNDFLIGIDKVNLIDQNDFYLLE